MTTDNARRQFEQAITNLEEILMNHHRSSVGRQLEMHEQYCKSAEKLFGKIKEMEALKSWPGNSDQRDVLALTYLGIHKSLGNQPLPSNLKNEIDPLVEQIHQYISEHHLDALVHGQQLAQSIGTPKTNRRGF